MLASGLGVYRFVKIGKISRKLHQLVRPSPPPKRRGQGIKTIVCPISLGLYFCAILSIHGAGFHASRPLLHNQTIQNTSFFDVLQNNCKMNSFSPV